MRLNAADHVVRVRACSSQDDGTDKDTPDRIRTDVVSFKDSHACPLHHRSMEWEGALRIGWAAQDSNPHIRVSCRSRVGNGATNLPWQAPGAGCYQSTSTTHWFPRSDSNARLPDQNRADLTRLSYGGGRGPRRDSNPGPRSHSPLCCRYTTKDKKKLPMRATESDVRAAVDLGYGGNHVRTSGRTKPSHY